ncbi:methylmalonyl-CoA mutase family protein [Rhizobium sp. EC-SD404]|uniref:methylmalonyl-CoA mutase family protein n=1 Tax=Rhizobium sp. EC-SD404 TaxID=2038389 RepID=UPI00125B420F|nr:methylmalonyl-CoA mutase family protein [Rhizobium sp. EC-SD404]VVT13783.1 Methylmalonyl-CoA mutase [Rhizobium sp. EC-SD404]
MTPDIFETMAFAPSSADDWRALVKRALKEQSFDDALVSRTDDGIAFGPIAGRVHEALLRIRSHPAQPWTISQRLDDPDLSRAELQIEADVGGGATGLSISLMGAASAYGFGVDVEQLSRHLATIRGVQEIRFDAPAKDLGTLLEAIEKRPEDDVAHVDLGISPLAEHAPDLIARAFDLDLDGTVMRADGSIAHNAGASEAQELGFSLAAAVEALRMAEQIGIDADSALAATEFVLSADQNQFLSIAKFRALRILHARLMEVLGIEEPFGAHLHAETSYRMLARRDPETNILRNTIAVFAAGIGGADSVSVLPHTLALGLPDRFARRIARNTQSVLIDEGHLAHVLDPGAGSGGIEHLTGELAEMGWQVFQQIEGEGGLAQSITRGLVTARIDEKRRVRHETLVAGDRTIIGTTRFMPTRDRPMNVSMERDPSTMERGALSPVRLDETLEAGEAA